MVDYVRGIGIQMKLQINPVGLALLGWQWDQKQFKGLCGSQWVQRVTYQRTTAQFETLKESLENNDSLQHKYTDWPV